MFKTLLGLTILCFTIQGHQAFAQSFMKSEVENEKQTDFPGIKIDNHDAPELYAISLDHDADDPKYHFEKVAPLKKGTSLQISSYIVAKDLIDSLDVVSVSNKTNRKELKEVMDSKDKTKLTKFILQMAEKLRTAENDKEQKILNDLIKKNKTGDDPKTTVKFKSGFIEVKPFEESDTRYFIPLSHLKNLSIDVEEGKVKLLQSMNLLAFKKIRSNVNFGYLSDDETKELEDLENNLTSACNKQCMLKDQAELSGLVMNVIDLSSYDFLQDLTIDPKKLNEKVFFAQICLVNNYTESCSNPALTTKLDKLLKRPGIKDILTKHSGQLRKACSEEFKK
jgi:hypothetical protein